MTTSPTISLSTTVLLKKLFVGETITSVPAGITTFAPMTPVAGRVVDDENPGAHWSFTVTSLKGRRGSAQGKTYWKRT